MRDNKVSCSCLSLKSDIPFTYFTYGVSIDIDKVNNIKSPNYDIWNSPIPFHSNLVQSSPTTSDSSGSDDSSGDSPSTEPIKSYKKLNLGPSIFENGCICGHNVEIRNTFHDSRRKHGTTIQPKIPPIPVILNHI